MFTVQNEDGNQQTLASLKEAISYAEQLNERATIINLATREALYEWSPDTGLRRYLVE